MFQGIENFAYLASKDILPGRRKAPKWMAVSNRFWMAQILLEGLRLLRVRQMGWREELGAQNQNEKVIKVQSEELKRRWRRDFWANAGWLPLTWHWSYVDESASPVGEVWQGVAGLVPSLIELGRGFEEAEGIVG